MVIGYHVIITAYGFWLPNDPRGSWSSSIRSWELFLAGGDATKIDNRRSVAASRYDPAVRRRAADSLARDPVIFSGLQAKYIGDGFARYAVRSGVPVHACSVLERHTHLVLGRPGYDVERAINLLKGAATTELIRHDVHPFGDVVYANGRHPTPWARRHWAVYLNTPDDMTRAIAYVENNPIKEGKPRQRWPFVRPL